MADCQATTQALILGTLFGCPVYRTYSAKIVSGDFEAGFTMNLGLEGSPARRRGRR